MFVMWLWYTILKIIAVGSENMKQKTKEQISYNMKQVKNKDSEIELLLRRELWKRGLRYRNKEDANGGYIVVKKDGNVVCYHIYNRNDFEQYLFDYTFFDRASTSRHGFMSIYKENYIYKINLNLQIRFR